MFDKDRDILDLKQQNVPDSDWYRSLAMFGLMLGGSWVGVSILLYVSETMFHIADVWYISRPLHIFLLLTFNIRGGRFFFRAKPTEQIHFAFVAGGIITIVAEVILNLFNAVFYAALGYGWYFGYLFPYTLYYIIAGAVISFVTAFLMRNKEKNEY